MWPLPVRELFFTGAAAAAKLNSLGIQTIGDLANSDVTFLKSHLKSYGEILWRYANGLDDSPVREEREQAKGYGNSTTLSKDVTEYGEAPTPFLVKNEQSGQNSCFMKMILEKNTWLAYNYSACVRLHKMEHEAAFQKKNPIRRTTLI